MGTRPALLNTPRAGPVPPPAPPSATDPRLVPPCIPGLVDGDLGAVGWASLGIWGEPYQGQLVKNPPAMWETWAQSLGWENSLEKQKATHSSILAWRIPRTA